MRLAFFSPLNPQPSGISDYSEALLPHLARLVESIDVFIENYQPASPAAAQKIHLRPWQEFEASYRAGRYEAVLYQIGNNPYHVYIYDQALRVPGVVVLHEFNLHYLVAYATVSRGDWDAYLREVERTGGPAALDHARRAQAGEATLDFDGIALNRTLLERSRAVIVHSEYMEGLLQSAGCLLPVRKIPHGVDVPAIDRPAARRRLAEATGFSLQDSTPVFGIFGFLKPYKRIYEALRALARLKADYPSVKMILAGEEHPHYPLRPLLSELGLEDSVKILGYLPLEQFTQLLAATDYCLNLRHPTAGETSGTLLRALGMGKPTLVSAIGSFADLPDDVVFKIPVDEREELWVYEYMRAWLDDPELARSVGERGRQYVQRTALWPDVAGQYLRFLEECIERPASQGVALPAAAGNGTSALTLSDDALAEYIIGFSHASRLMEEYVLSHLRRLVRTLRLTPAGGPDDRILELGCYLQITPALQSLLGYGEVRGAYYGTAGQQVTRSAVSITGEVFSCRIDLFDAERDPFPYPPGYFQTVLCCELLEHLATDPMHMMAEINRVLAVGGHLLLTTPNIASFRSVRAVLHGDHPGMFPAYIKPAADGSVDPRHSREYTPGEIARLAEAAGFFVERLETGGYAPQEPDSAWARRFLESNGLSTELRGELIYCLARKVAPLRDRWPKDFYYP